MSTTSAAAPAKPQPIVDGKFAKKLVIACAIVPGILLVWDALRHQLGVNDVNFAIRTTGLLGIVFLSLSLAVTPLKKLTGWNSLISVRRNLGVYGFIYIAAHFSIFFWWDRSASIGSTLTEIVERVYLWFGTGALVLMIPLAITSTDGMVTRLGAKKWKRLHRLAYVVVAFGLVHYWLLVKSDTTKPLAFTIAVCALLALRFVPQRKKAGPPKFWRGELTLAKITDETHDAKTFRFTPKPFDHIAGQYMTLNLVIDGKRVNRSYTISSSPHQKDYVEITVKRADAGNGGSKHVHATFAEGQKIKISAPAGKFFFTGKEAKRIVLIAGGVGITPAMSVIRFLTSKKWAGEIYLAYAVRTAKDVIFQAELDEILKKHPNVKMDLVLSSERGHITAALLHELVPNFKNGPVMMCGPTPMMGAMRKLLVEEIGILDWQVHEEVFTSTSIADAPSVDAPTEGDPDAVYGVHFSKTDKRAQVSLTVLEAAEECGVEIAYECRSGVCGQCKTRLVSGRVVMDVQDALTAADKAKGLVLACQARPLHDIVVDA